MGKYLGSRSWRTDRAQWFCKEITGHMLIEHIYVNSYVRGAKITNKIVVEASEVSTLLDTVVKCPLYSAGFIRLRIFLDVDSFCYTRVYFLK